MKRDTGLTCSSTSLNSGISMCAHRNVLDIDFLEEILFTNLIEKCGRYVWMGANILIPESNSSRKAGIRSAFECAELCGDAESSGQRWKKKKTCTRILPITNIVFFRNGLEANK